MEKTGNIQKAYKASQNIYDATLTQQKWWAKLYIRLFWNGVDDHEIAAKVLASLPKSGTGKLLDVPVGTAVFTHKAYRAMPEWEITGVDYSQDMLRQAQQRFDEKGFSHVVCQQGDVGDLSFAKESFDVVLSMNGFHAFPQKQRAFDETARVLKTGGTFCGCFYIKGQCKRTDFLVQHFLAKKGWFTPPFFTRQQLQTELQARYAQVELHNESAMAWFRCIK